MVNPVGLAYAEESPLLVISGGPETRFRSHKPQLHHCVKNFNTQRNVFNEVCESVTILDNAATARDEIDRVFDTTITSSKPGYIEIPRDMVNLEVHAPEQNKAKVQFNGDKDSEYVKNAQEIGTQFHSVAEVVINHMIENDIEINDTKNLKQLTETLFTDLKTNGKLDGFLTDADLFYNDNDVHKTELRKSIINSVLKSFIFILDDIEGDSLNNLFVMTEFTSYSNEYAGTQDLVAIYKDKKGILQVKIIDYKTSKLKYNEETIQKKYAEKNNYYKELFENIIAGIVEPDNIQTVISLIKANTILSLDLIELEKDGESITIKEYLESKLEEGEVLEFLSEKTGEETYYTLGKMTDEGGKTYSALFYKVKGEPNERMDIDFIAYVKKGYLIQSFKHESDTIIKYSLNPKKTLLESKDRQAYYQLLVLKKLLEGRLLGVECAFVFVNFDFF